MKARVRNLPWHLDCWRRTSANANMKTKPNDGRNDHRSAWLGTLTLIGISIACVLGAWMLIETMNRLLR
jgi:hypothetical protein